MRTGFRSFRVFLGFVAFLFWGFVGSARAEDVMKSTDTAAAPEPSTAAAVEVYAPHPTFVYK